MDTLTKYSDDILVYSSPQFDNMVGPVIVGSGLGIGGCYFEK